jgi:2-amino-4-hydroxy-6-hydroxymethyldihydropteridine diphosphokinase
MTPMDEQEDFSRLAAPLTAVIALGANLGDRLGALQGAVNALDDHADVKVTGVSHVYSTAPVGGPEQADYLNAVVLVETTLPPVQLLELAHNIESTWRRTREIRWGPRTLDVDLIRVGDIAMNTESLTLPHPRAYERAFVCIPWSDVEPDMDLPDLDSAGVERTEFRLRMPGDESK